MFDRLLRIRRASERTDETSNRTKSVRSGLSAAMLGAHRRGAEHEAVRKGLLAHLLANPPRWTNSVRMDEALPKYALIAMRLQSAARIDVHSTEPQQRAAPQTPDGSESHGAPQNVSAPVYDSASEEPNPSKGKASWDYTVRD